MGAKSKLKQKLRAEIHILSTVASPTDTKKEKRNSKVFQYETLPIFPRLTTNMTVKIFQYETSPIFPRLTTNETSNVFQYEVLRTFLRLIVVWVCFSQLWIFTFSSTTRLLMLHAKKKTSRCVHHMRARGKAPEKLGMHIHCPHNLWAWTHVLGGHTRSMYTRYWRARCPCTARVCAPGFDLGGGRIGDGSVNLLSEPEIAPHDFCLVWLEDFSSARCSPERSSDCRDRSLARASSSEGSRTCPR